MQFEINWNELYVFFSLYLYFHDEFTRFARLQGNYHQQPTETQKNKMIIQSPIEYLIATGKICSEAKRFIIIVKTQLIKNLY